jgi:hypothetical protein
VVHPSPCSQFECASPTQRPFALTPLRHLVDAVLRGLGFSHGVNDVALCYNGDYLLMHEWFEINRSLLAQARLERRDVRGARRAWESREVFEQLRRMRLALARGELLPTALSSTPIDVDVMHAAHAKCVGSWRLARSRAALRHPKFIYIFRLPSSSTGLPSKWLLRSLCLHPFPHPDGISGTPRS